MFRAPKARPRAEVDAADFEATNELDADVTRLRVVDSDAYPDWEAVYTDNVERLYRLIYARVGNRPDAEDLTSEVFRTALGPLRLSSSKGEVRSYLLTTAQTVLASHWRRTLSISVTSIDPLSDFDELVEPALVKEQSDAPQRASGILATLPDRYRRILELRFLEACSIKEAAQTMGVSVANAKVLQHRALRMAARVGTEEDEQ
jgi:RNA polymerase sigma-70 factor (ECF subfamily)